MAIESHNDAGIFIRHGVSNGDHADGVLGLADLRPRIHSAMTLLAVGLMAFVVAGKANVDDIMMVAFDVLVFGFFFYFVTVQCLMQRKASEITDRDEFRETMESEGKFRGLAKFVYHLPGPLLVGAIGLAVIGKWLY